MERVLGLMSGKATHGRECKYGLMHASMQADKLSNLIYFLLQTLNSERQRSYLRRILAAGTWSP